MKNKLAKKISVLITGVGGGGIGMQVLKSLRIARIPYKIIGTDIDKFSFGLYKVDSPYIIPSASDIKFLPTLLEICQQEKVQVLIPGSEPELKKISENRKEFEKLNILLLINDKNVINLCMDKWETYKFFKKNNLGFPESFLIKKESDIEKIKKFPVIVKPATGSRGSANTFIGQDKEDLVAIFKYLSRQNIILLAQEYIGSAEEEYTVGVLTTFEGKLINSIIVKRIVQGTLSSKIRVENRYKERVKGDFLIVSSGISQGIIDDFPDVRRYAEKVAQTLGSKGPLNIQCRKNKNGVLAFEVNPRFSGTTFLRALVGYNEADILIRHYVLGEKIRPVHYKKGVILRDLLEQILDNKKITKIF